MRPMISSTNIISLLTSPVSVAEIVVGKYLAAMAVFGVTVAVSFIYPAVIMIYGNPVVSEIIGSYIGFILLWGTLISIGVFVSSFTESQTIAGVVTFTVLFVIYCIAWVQASIEIEFIRKFLGCFALFSKYNEFQYGILDIQSVIYYLSFIFVFLFLTVRVYERRRWN